nr:MAG TPA: hypothetical protein [Caudoviricetes sp.]
MLNRSVIKSQQTLAFCLQKGGKTWNMYHQ